jgi:hypothetical protein
MNYPIFFHRIKRAFRKHDVYHGKEYIMKIHTRLFIIILFISALFISALSSGNQQEQTATPVPEKEEDDDIKIDFNIFKKVGSDGKYIVPRIGPGSRIPSVEIPRTLPPNSTPGTTRITIPPKSRDQNLPSLPVVVPGDTIKAIPHLPSIPPPYTESTGGVSGRGLPPGQSPGSIPGPPSTKGPGDNMIPASLPPSTIWVESPIETPIEREKAYIPIPGSISIKDSNIGSLSLPTLQSEGIPGNEGSETSSPSDIPSLPRVKDGKNVTDLNMPQNLTIEEEASPSPGNPRQGYPIPSTPNVGRSVVDPSMKVPDISMEEESSPAPHVADNLPATPLVVESDPLNIPKGNISLPPSTDDTSRVPGMENITEVPLVESPVVADTKIPDQLPILTKATPDTSDDTPGIKITASEIEYKIIQDWKDRNLLFDGDFEAIPYLEKDAWFAENCSLKRELKLTGDISLAPKSGNQLAVVYGKSEDDTALYQLINVESLSGLVDKGRITLEASLSASSLSGETVKVKLTVLCWGYGNDEGKMLKKSSEIIPISKGVWGQGNIRMDEIPASTRLIQFHISMKNTQGVSEPLIALDGSRLNLIMR